MNQYIWQLSYIAFNILIVLILLTIIVQLYLYRHNQHENFLNFSHGFSNYTQCKNLKRKYEAMPNISGIAGSKYKMHPLKDFYVKTAYNCVALENYLTGSVDSCAITTCLNQGARCLDFEVFTSIDDANRHKCVVALSDEEENVKQISSSNKIAFDDVLKIINRQAFTNVCPAPNDPLILHIRIKSNDRRIINMILNSINTHIKSRLLSVKYGYGAQNFKGRIGDVSIQDLSNKIVLLFHSPHIDIQSTSLFEYTNGLTGGSEIKVYRNDDIKPEKDSLTEYNKDNMTFILPKLHNKMKNYDFGRSKMLGCQFIAMSHQNKDQHIDDYHEFFNINKYSFVLKPENLRIPYVNKVLKDTTYFKYEIDE